jgi:hypothetical protein
MGGLNESVEIETLDPKERDEVVARLHDPWIGDEDALDVAFHRHTNGHLRQRGVAFDDELTVVWDEDCVQVLRAAKPECGVVALRSQVLLRERFRENGPARLFRIDYLRRGTLLGSRWIAEGGRNA